MVKSRKRKSQAQVEDLQPSKRQELSSPLPNGVHHYQNLEDVPWDIQKYWHQGYSIFSKYDDGIWMTDDAWFGVTHESVAIKIANHVAKAAPQDRAIVVDPFCGVGGNTIALALSGRWKRVYAIERDPATLACARHNADIYGVGDKITWFEGDCFEILGLKQGKENDTPLATLIQRHGVIFASPPWGGPTYTDSDVFDVETMAPYSLTHLYDNFSRISNYVALYLPRSSDVRQIAKKVRNSDQTQVIHYCTRGASRALCVYYGHWGRIP
ncbi:uncharacterized protein HMPREF1541_05392 [Cyphellophora europaea CBS 101466]|uniref:Trimethylguanosine synthase n=1 Tax=Cyphellophora europaea (strain CBS 101466) TaxID=1220924 RepID=W2RTW8_CYPE1|nr:uncharacterized protein HMPREF1541_05392 [Cyphellophora europaea CBS 101466]ETN39169.1 hypothetical protein HMPREF1541_05392 [Cyphellophora europaea CBS 101466]